MKTIQSVLFALFVSGEVINAQSFEDIVPLYFMDDFKDNTNNWLQENGQNYMLRIRNNHMEVSNGSNGALQTFSKNYMDFPENEKLGIEMRYMITQNYKGLGVSLRCGMGNRGREYISYTINEKNQTFKISAFVQKGKKFKEKELTKWKPLSFMKKGDYNVMTIERDGDVGIFRMNGKVVAEVEGITEYWKDDAFALKTGAGVTAMFDGVAVYSFRNLTRGERGKFSPFMHKHTSADDFAMSYLKYADNVVDENAVPFDDQVTDSNVKSFFLNFAPLKLPYYFNYQNAQGRDITSIDPKRRIGVVYALGEVATCSDRRVVLVMNRYQKNGADVSNFWLESYDANGKSLLADKLVATTIKENGQFFKISEWNAVESINQIIFSSTTKLTTGKTESKKVTVNTAFCQY